MKNSAGNCIEKTVFIQFSKLSFDLLNNSLNHIAIREKKLPKKMIRF